jgi:aspartate aminotransferase
MQRVAARLSRLSESQTLAMARKSRELQAQGIDIINLSIGEPDYDTPDYVKDFAKWAIDNNYTHYPPVPGFLDLRKAICEKLLRDNQLEYTPEQIVVSTGAKQSLANIILSLVDAGDEVIVPVPYWVSYIELIKLAEGQPVFVYSDVSTQFKLNPDELKKVITPKTRMIILNSPSNPSGAVYSHEELSAIADVLKDYPEIIIVSDEIYELINYQGNHASPAQFSFLKDRTIIVNGVSKGYAMTGWRIGYIAAPLWISKACEKMQGQFTSGASSISQMAALEAIRQSTEKVDYMKEGFLKRRNLAYSELSKIEGLKVNVPDGAFYFFPDIRSFIGKSFNGKIISNSNDLCMFLLEEGRVALVSGDAFGDDHCIRFSYATSEQKILEAINRISIALKKLI